MENDVKELLNRILANQVAIYKKLDGIENKLNNKSRSTGDESRVRDLEKESNRYLPIIKS